MGTSGLGVSCKVRRRASSKNWLGCLAGKQGAEGGEGEARGKGGKVE